MNLIWMGYSFFLFKLFNGLLIIISILFVDIEIVFVKPCDLLMTVIFMS